MREHGTGPGEPASVDRPVQSSAAKIDTRAFRDVMSQVCAPVSVVTTLVGGEPYGSTVSSLCSLSLEPPMVLIALDRESRLLAMIRRRGRFGVNVLGERQADLASRFATALPERFADAQWTTIEGLPRLDGGIAWLSCDVRDYHLGGDHVIVTGLVRQGCAREGRRPLTYHGRGYGTHVDRISLPVR